MAENSAGTTYGSEYFFKTPASSTAIKAKVLETTVPDSNGYFKFENFVANNYIIFAKKQGYKQGKLKIKLDAGETKDVEIKIKPS